MTKRLNIVLPVDTVRSIDRLAKPGERSRFMDRAVVWRQLLFPINDNYYSLSCCQSRAVNHFLATQSQEALRERLETTALRDRDLDAEVSADWFAADKHTWDQLDKSSPFKVTPKGAKFTSPRSTRR